jgi:adenylate cyclase
MTLLARRPLLWLLPLAVPAAALVLYTHLGGFAAAWQDAWFERVKEWRSFGPLRQPDWAMQAEMIALWLGSLAVILPLSRERIAIAGLIGFILALAGPALALYLAIDQGLFLNGTYFALAMLATLAAGLIVNATAGVNARAEQRRSLAAHLPPAAINFVIRHPEKLTQAGETRNVTYLVCHIRSYTALAQSFLDDPSALSDLTRRILSPLADAVLEHSGAIDCVTPGGLGAFFNAPLDDAEHAIHACACAQRMMKALEQVNRILSDERRADGKTYPPVTIGIGIHSGPAIAGNFGTQARPDYRVAGRVPAFAHLIERMSSIYGPAIIVSDGTRKLADRQFAFLEVDLVTTDKDNDPLKLYALLGDPQLRASPQFRALQTFHEHIFEAYRAQQWDKARELLEQCRKLSAASPGLYDLYEKRIARHEAQPPSGLWNGATFAELQ